MQYVVGRKNWCPPWMLFCLAILIDKGLWRNIIKTHPISVIFGAHSKRMSLPYCVKVKISYIMLLAGKTCMAILIDKGL